MLNRPLALIIDADRETARAMGIRLLQAGYQIATAHDAESGILTANERLPDVVVLQVGSQHVDSSVVVKALKEKDVTKSIPIIATAAHSAGRKFANAIGATAFVIKSHNPSELVGYANQAIANASSNELSNARHDPPHHSARIAPRLLFAQNGNSIFKPSSESISNG